MGGQVLFFVFFLSALKERRGLEAGDVTRGQGN